MGNDHFWGSVALLGLSLGIIYQKGCNSEAQQPVPIIRRVEATSQVSADRWPTLEAMANSFSSDLRQAGISGNKLKRIYYVEQDSIPFRIEVNYDSSATNPVLLRVSHPFTRQTREFSYDGRSLRNLR